MSTSTSFPQFQLRSRSMGGLGFRRRLQVDAVLTDRQPAEVQHVAQQLFSSMHASLASRASDFLRSVACRVNMNLSAYPIISTMLADAGAAIARACDLPASFPLPGPGVAAPAMQTTPGSADLSSPDAPLLQQFLDRADRLEVLYACLLSDLSNMAYEVSRLEDEQELRRHSLTLVSSSAWPLYGPVRQEEGAAAAAAAGAGGPQPVSGQHGKREARRSTGSSSGHAAAAKPSSSRHGAKGKAAAPQQGIRTSGGGTGVQAAATSPPRSSPAAASTHRSAKRVPLSSAPVPPGRTHALGATSVNHALPAAAAAATCLDSIDSVLAPAAAEAKVDAVPLCSDGSEGASREAMATSGGSSAAAKGATPGNEAALLTAPPPPAAWFCADDTATQTRYIVIQGSTSIGHWAINLNIEPVPFEDAALGVRVHRGVYETAIQLYDELLPLVRQHLASSPDARVALGGHSLGGSVAAVIMLLLVCRAGVPPERLAPSYAFGAPAVFCAAGAGGCPHPGSSSSPPPPSAPASTPASPTSAASVSATSSLDHCGACAASRAANLGAAASHGAPPAPCSARRSLMARFGIPESLLTNVVMHKDIVPRAFLCNYTVVADFLKRFMPSFKDHSTLSASHEHKYLYTYIGTVAVLRPDDNAPFVLNDNAHPMLPDEAGLYKLRDPQRTPSPTLAALSTTSSQDSAGGSTQPHHPDPDAADAAPPDAAPPAANAAVPAVLPSLRAALLAFMDYPHPLQYLSTLSSYGTEGAISRYHNPANYTRGLARLLEPLTSQWTHLTH